MPQVTKAKLIKKEYHHEEICEFVLKMEEKIEWKAGQFAMIAIHDGQEPVVKRAYSIASSPTKSPQISFVVKYVEGGRGTSWLFDSVEEGDKLELMLPFGHMILNEEAEEILLIATGIGIPPMISIIEKLEENNFKKPTRLVFGCRYENQLCHHEQFQKFAKKYENFHYFPIASRPSDEWTGKVGRADSVLESLDIDFKSQNAYICGSPDVAKSLKEIIIKKGTNTDNIQIEAF